MSKDKLPPRNRDTREEPIDDITFQRLLKAEREASPLPPEIEERVRKRLKTTLAAIEKTERRPKKRPRRE